MSIEKALSEYFRQSRLPILFAGAGVSVQGGLPAWPGYLSKLAAAAGEYDPYIKFIIDKAVDDGALTDAASFYFMCREMPDSKKLLGLQEPLLEFEWEKLASLAKLPFQAVVTTNFDRLLFAAYAKAVGVSAREVNIDDPALSAAQFAEDFFVARLHGRVEIPTSMHGTDSTVPRVLAQSVTLPWSTGPSWTGGWPVCRRSMNGQAGAAG